MPNGKETTKTLKALFIIESLDFEDEKTRREGKILQQILRLSGEKVRYIYIRTSQELPFALEEFRRSNYRYLHISCHGSRDTVALTLDQLPFEDFAAEVCPFLSNRRLFFSACSVVNEELAKTIIPASGCYSIVGPKQKSIWTMLCLCGLRSTTSSSETEIAACTGARFGGLCVAYAAHSV